MKAVLWKRMGQNETYDQLPGRYSISESGTFNVILFSLNFGKIKAMTESTLECMNIMTLCAGGS